MNRLEQLARGLDLFDFSEIASKSAEAALEKLKEGQGDQGGEGETGAKLDPEVEKRLKAYETELEKTRKMAEDERKKRQEQEQKADIAERRSILSSTLTELGVADEFLKPVTSYLFNEEQRIVRTEDGKVMYRTDDPLQEHVPVKDGLSEWAKGPGKNYLRARDVQGSGNAGGKPDGQAGGKQKAYSKAEVANFLITGKNPD